MFIITLSAQYFIIVFSIFGRYPGRMVGSVGSTDEESIACHNYDGYTIEQPLYAVIAQISSLIKPINYKSSASHKVGTILKPQSRMQDCKTYLRHSSNS